jgi:Sulfotransferase domain
MIVKHFSQATTQFKTLHAAMPEARCMFMYRDGKSWTNSIYHFAQKMGGKMIVDREVRDFAWWIISGNSSKHELDGIVDLDAEFVTFDTLAAVAWALHIRQYKEASADGVPMMAVRYNELTNDREKTIARIFEYCGISTDAAANTLDAFDADSQEGTRTARSIAVAHFDDENYRRVAEVFANSRIAIDPNLILPDSFKN